MHHPLEQAAKLIEDFCQTLDTSRSVCPCCQIERYANWRQGQADKELRAIIRKIRRWQESLSNQPSK